MLTVALSMASVACERPHPPRPNFVVILADDLGYADVAAFGSERNSTPSLDRMAAHGLRFTDFHSSGPMCTPTRAAFLTGQYPHRLGPDFESALSGITDYDIGLPLGAHTLAEELAAHGYRTGMYGKWHLGYHPPFLPVGQGFHEFRGLASGDGDHHSHIDRSGRPDWWHNSELAPEEGYGVDLITDHSVDFIRRHREEPFFLYVAHLAIHFPWQGPADTGYRIEGGDYHNLTKLGVLESQDVSAKVKEMVEAVDGSVGRILEALLDAGLERRTLVFFTSDNGGYRTYQGGYHNISENGPLRGQKGQVYEGGHRVPAIAYWPGRIEPGTSDAVGATFDLFPTFRELAGLPNDGPCVDGTALTPVLLEGRPLAPRLLFWRIRDERAVRQGQWKLVQVPGEPHELYDLSVDLGESDNVAAAHPEVVDRLRAGLERWEGDIREGCE